MKMRQCVIFVVSVITTNHENYRKVKIRVVKQQ